MSSDDQRSAKPGALPRDESSSLPSLRTLVTLIVVLPIAAAATLMLFISALTSRNISEQLGEELITAATARVSGQVTNYISQAMRLSDLYARRLEMGRLSATDLHAWQPVMFDDLLTAPDVASICFGNPSGDSVYLQRAHGRLELGYADGSRDCAAIEWRAFPDGTADTEHPLRTYRYDPRTRPWYTAAIESGQATWTPAYFWFGDAGGAMETGTGYTRQIVVKGKLAGVLTVDVTLGAVSNFLQKQPFASKGAIFIVDDQGYLIAASEGPVTSPDGKRITLAASGTAFARAVAERAPQTTTSLATAATMPSGGLGARAVEVAGVGPARANFTAFTPYPGTRWRVITVLPESAFLSQAHAMRTRSLWLAAIAVVGAVIVGIVFSRRISRPIIRLCRHVKRIGAGDFAARLDLEGARELQQLAAETNRMAAGLRERMEMEKSLELATHVQQSLLPKTTPGVRGLEIIGHSRYCESTGGDYLDFIDVADLPNDRAFIAVGDVMGHGIGSALLMATARASVRTSAALGNETLGQIMARVNDVLARDARHGLFMTMLLLIVEPADGIVRWASAGHDPALLYDPETDEFHELEGADLILGVEVGCHYNNFQHIGIKPGCVLFIGTDGVWEARDAGHDMFGKERLRDVIRAAARRGEGSARDVAAALERALDTFVGSSKFHDDVTFVVAKFVPLEAPVESLPVVSVAGEERL